MTFIPILALGITTQSIFIGGNVVLSSLIIPIIKNSDDLTPLVQVKTWEKIYHGGAKLLGGSGVISALSYSILAYDAKNQFDFNSFLIAAISSILILPFTGLIMRSNIQLLKKYATFDNDYVKSTNYDDVIAHWNYQSIARLFIFSIGFVSVLNRTLF